MDETDALLVVERGPAPSLRFALAADQVTIGRSAGNELVLADPEVSRRHARVLRRADGYAVEDIGSTNGTFVNGQRISHLTLLQDGDTIDLGDTVRLRFVAPVIAPTPIPPAPVDVSERPTEMLAAAPAGELQNYANELKSMTGGAGTWPTAPANVAVMAKHILAAGTRDRVVARTTFDVHRDVRRDPDGDRVVAVVADDFEPFARGSTRDVDAAGQEATDSDDRAGLR